MPVNAAMNADHQLYKTAVILLCQPDELTLQHTCCKILIQNIKHSWPRALMVKWQYLRAWPVTGPGICQ